MIHYTCDVCDEQCAEKEIYKVEINVKAKFNYRYNRDTNVEHLNGSLCSSREKELCSDCISFINKTLEEILQ